MDSEELFDKGVVACAGEFLAHGFGIVTTIERAYLDVKKFVLWFGADGGAEAVLAQRVGQSLGIRAILNGGDLHDDAAITLTQLQVGQWLELATGIGQSLRFGITAA